MRTQSYGEMLIDNYRERGDAYADIAWIRSGILDEDEKLAIGMELREISRRRRTHFSVSGSFEAPTEPEHRDAPPEQAGLMDAQIIGDARTALLQKGGEQR